MPAHHLDFAARHRDRCAVRCRGAFAAEPSDGAGHFVGGDEAPQLQLMKSKFVAKYDADGKKAMQLRQVWWQQGNDQRWRFLFYHDVNTPVFQGGTTGAV